MNQIRIREFEKLEYREPHGILVELRNLERREAISKLPPQVRHLRTNSLNSFREMREGALFCYGMSERIGSARQFLSRARNHKTTILSHLGFPMATNNIVVREEFPTC